MYYQEHEQGQIETVFARCTEAALLGNQKSVTESGQAIIVYLYLGCGSNSSSWVWEKCFVNHGVCLLRLWNDCRLYVAMDSGFCTHNTTILKQGLGDENDKSK